jgi:hypothetical protein
MRRLFGAAVLGSMLSFGIAHEACAQETAFLRLKAADIRKTFSGQEFSDQVHWSERYISDGTVEGSSMGRRFTKRWVITHDQICVTDNEGEDCREVWKDGSTIELRRWSDDDLAKTGVIRRPRR